MEELNPKIKNFTHQCIREYNLEKYIERPFKDCSKENEGGFWIFRPIMTGEAVAIMADLEESESVGYVQCPDKVAIPNAYDDFASGEYDVVAMIITERERAINPYSVVRIPDSIEEIHFERNSHLDACFEAGNNARYRTADGDLFSADGKIWFHHHQRTTYDGTWPGTEIPDGVEVLETGVLNYQYTWDLLVMPASVRLIKEYALAEARIETIDFGDNVPEVEEKAFNSSRSCQVGKVRINRVWKDIPEGFLERVLQRIPSKFGSCICKAPDLQEVKETVPGMIEVTDMSKDELVTIKLDDIDFENISEYRIETYDGPMTGTSITFVRNGNHPEEAVHVYESPSVVNDRIALARS